MTSFQRWVAARTEDELIATFGNAQMVRETSGKLKLKGGSEEDREQARLWFETFLMDAEVQPAPGSSGGCESTSN